MTLPVGANELLDLRKAGKVWDSTLVICFGFDKCKYFSVIAKPNVKYDWRFVYQADCFLFWNLDDDWRETAKQIIKFCKQPLEFYDFKKQIGTSLWWSPTMESIEKCIRYNLPTSKLKNDFSSFDYPKTWNERYHKDICFGID